MSERAFEHARPLRKSGAVPKAALTAARAGRRPLAAALVLVLVSVLVSGCALFAPDPRPAPDMPATFEYDDAAREAGQTLFAGAGYAERVPPGPWWEAFNSTELDSLIREALSGNFDIRTAWARLRQARATARKAGARLWPELDGSGGADWRKSRSAQTRRTTGTENYELGLAASYELDLWGRLYSSRQAESFLARAALEDVDAAAVTVAAEVADTWVSLLAVRREKAILAEQIEVNETLLEIQRNRFSYGLAKALDVSQQQENLASIRADMPLLKVEEETLTTRLALLLGRVGVSGVEATDETLPPLIPLPGTGVPADLLAGRPDVRAAGRRLEAADWRISQARADRLPSISLRAQAAYASQNIDTVFSGWMSALAASLTAPIFDAGLRAAEVDRTLGAAEERLVDYVRTVAEAVAEVEDALVREARQREYIDLLNQELAAARMALVEARHRYVNGDSDYLNYLTEIQNTQRLERVILAQEARLISYRVALYRALGGDWTRNLPPLPAGQAGEGDAAQGQARATES